MTSYLDMPLNSDPPVLDKSGFLAKWNFGKASSLVDFGLWGGLTPGSLDDMQELTDCGVIGFKAFMSSSGVDDFPMADDGALLEGMRRAFDLEQIVAVHAENDGITAHLARQAVAEGRLTAADYLASRPVVAELEAIQRAIFLAWEAECALHIVHVSTARGLDLVAGAKAQGMNISCETAPHYLILTEADVERLGPLAKCAPPSAQPGGTTGAVGTTHRGRDRHDRLRPFARHAGDEIPRADEGRLFRRLGRDRRVPVDAAAHAHGRRWTRAPFAARPAFRTAGHGRRAPLPAAPGKRARSPWAGTPIWSSSTPTPKRR